MTAIGNEAELLSALMKNAVDLCKQNQGWNIALNMMGLLGSPEVKVFYDNSVVCMFGGEDISILMDEAVTYLIHATHAPGTPTDWSRFTYCNTCNAAPMCPCRGQGDKPIEAPHPGRLRF